MRNVQLSKKDVLILPKETAAQEAARAMNEKFVGCALVSDGKGHIIGIITDRDLACSVLGDRLSEFTPIFEVMTPNPEFVDENASLLDVVNVMKKFAVRRVPVMSTKHGKGCVGIYTVDDLIISGEVPISELISVIKKQIKVPVKRHDHFEKLDSQREQNLNRFNKVIAREMGLSKDIDEEVVFFLLKSIVKAIPYKNAVSFIAELPALLHEDLQSLLVEPRNISSYNTIKESIAKRFGFSEDRIVKLMRSFWCGIKKAMHGDSIVHLLENLPNDLIHAFKPVDIDMKGKIPYTVGHESFCDEKIMIGGLSSEYRF